MVATASDGGVEPSKLSRAYRIVKNSLMGIGLSAVLIAVLLFNSTSARTSVASVLSNWATQSTATEDAEFVLAPFDFENLTAESNVIPDGSSKHPVRVLASLPVLELSELSDAQVRVTNWIANKYRVAPEMVALLVQESWNIGERTGLDPTLLLAIIAIESRFNPYAQSVVGASGLMQVMPDIHADKFDRTGGVLTAYDPVTNLRVGVLVLQEHIKRAGSLEGGLRQYVGASGPNDYGYTRKVLEERDRIRRVIFGSSTPDIERILLAARNLNDRSRSVDVQHASAIRSSQVNMDASAL